MVEGPLLLEFHAIPAYITYTWLAMAILIGLAILVRISLSKTAPTGIQNIFEAIIGGLEKYMVENMGPEGRPFLPLVGTLFLFILVCNLLGLIPGFESPTANWNTTLPLAVIVFLVTHAVGIGKWGAKYIKHFFGPLWGAAVLMFPIEIISHLARVITLSVRLFGNMIAKHILLIVLFIIFPYLLQVPILGLGFLVAFVQAGVFALLTIMYIAGSLEASHLGAEH
ncbi:MAG: F0F1 ATP synthase subunit A [Nitrospirota bacterium]